MPPLQQAFGSAHPQIRALSVGTGTDLPTMRQDLAAQSHDAPDADRIWVTCRRDILGRGAAMAFPARRRYSGIGFVAANIHVCDVARDFRTARELSIEMRTA